MPATGFRASCKKMAKKAIKNAVAKAEDSFAKKGPEDPEAYAAQVAETIKADVRYVFRYRKGCVSLAREPCLSISW